jgi:hypothetical protein
MNRLMVLSAMLTCLWGCADECAGLCGSQCDNMDCSYDRIQCQLYDGEGIKILYERTEGASLDYAAIIYCDIVCIDEEAGNRVEGQAFLECCNIDRPPQGEAWPDFTGNFCDFSSGGFLDGAKMSGKCSFVFVNGYFATASFSCTLEAVAQQ